MHTSSTSSVGLRLVITAMGFLLGLPLFTQAQSGNGADSTAIGQTVIDTTSAMNAAMLKRINAKANAPRPQSERGNKVKGPKAPKPGKATAPGQTKPAKGPAMGKGKTREMATPAPTTGEPFVLRPVYKGQPYSGNPVSSNDTLRFEFWVNGKPCPTCALEDIQVSVADVSGQRDTLYSFKKLPVRLFSLPIKPLLKQTWLRNPNRVEITVYGVETPIRFLYSDELKLPVIINILPQLR